MRFHIVGIGGAGMSAVARLLLAHGGVSGSDDGRWPLGEALRSHGATVHETFDPAHLAGADIVVRSSAYHEDHPEVAAALAQGIPVWRRHDAWRFLAQGKRVVAIAGTHGKTTTTAMTWTALHHAGIDASLICGAALAETGSNAHLGTSDVLVIEADEYDRVFHALTPAVAVVTNVDHDHIDLYPTPQSYRDAFRAFADGIVPGGTLVACADDAGAAALATAVRELPEGRRVWTYGAAAGATWRVGLADGTLRGPAGEAAGIRPRVPGAHNLLNAAAAFAAAVAIGADAGRVAPGLAHFSGTARRLETLGSADGITVIDDYAHHPVELRASIAAVARPGARVIALFQPHTAGRLDAFFGDFVAALRQADAAVVAETFASARQDADGRGLARELATRAGAAYARDPAEAAGLLADLARAGDTVLVLGAGDIRAAGVRLLELLRGRTPV